MWYVSQVELKKRQEYLFWKSIGTQKEKTVHQFLKYYICNNSEYHEININRNVVDILIDNHIYEIQTRSFNSLDFF